MGRWGVMHVRVCSVHATMFQLLSTTKHCSDYFARVSVCVRVCLCVEHEDTF